MFITEMLASALNKQLSSQHRVALSGFAGRTVGCRHRLVSMNWQIRPDGGFAAASPLVDADVLVRVAGGAAQLQGDAKLLRLLSEIWNKTDWPVVISSVFGPILAPRVLYFIGRGTAAFAAVVKQHTVSPAEVAAYGGQVENFHEAVNHLSARLAAVTAGAK